MTMKITSAADENKHEWDKFVIDNFPPAGAFMQSWTWGDFQKDLGRAVGRYLVMDGVRNVAAFTLVEYRLPLGFAYGYSPRGPVIAKGLSDKEIVEAFKTVKVWATEKFPHLVFLRLEPPLKNFSSDLHNPYFRFPPYYVQPRFNEVVSLIGSEADIAASFHPSTRSNLHRAEKRGVTVAMKTKLMPEDHAAFSLMMRDTIARNSGKNAYPGERYFQSLFASIPFLDKEDYDEDSLSLSAFYGYRDLEPASVHFVLFFGKTATYLYGASRTKHMSAKVDTYLHWKAMLEAKRRGCEYYDLGGIDESRWPSLTVYKRQFRGTELDYAGNIDIPFKKFLYHVYASIRKIKH